MEDPFIRRPGEWPGASQTTERAEGERQRIWLRRMLFLLVACCLAFALTTFWFSHLSTSLSIEKADAQATSVVRQHFAALERGDYHAAYEQFSTRYRRRMPFEVFVEMVVGHWKMLSGQATLFPRSQTPNRVIVHVDFAGSGSISVAAEFTVIRDNGRWWIDDVSWRRKRTPRLIET
jgi:ketosteroid isomerase-like protein